jgi:hypothetical protein
VACSIAAVALGPSEAAADAGDPSSPSAIQIHGFASQGAFVTTRNDYLVSGSTKGSFQLSEVGINFTDNITEKLRAGIQLFAQDFGINGNYGIEADWFYLDYRFADWLGFRAGRLKLPFGLYNEVNDVDAARVPILLPQSVYPLQNRQFLFAQTGFEIYGFARSSWAGALDYRLFAGTISLDPLALRQPGANYQAFIDVPYMTGGRVMWETPLDGLRLGGSLEALELDSTITNLMMKNLPSMGQVNDVAQLYVGSVEYAHDDLLLAAEYSRWHTRQTGDLVPPNESESERMYGMITYRVAHWLQPGAYYSLYFPYTKNRWGNDPTVRCESNVIISPKSACWQQDVALTLRFDVTPNWLIKVEGHFMDGTAAVSSPLKPGSPPTDPPKDWEALFAKTTVYF